MVVQVAVSVVAQSGDGDDHPYVVHVAELEVRGAAVHVPLAHKLRVLVDPVHF